MRRKSILCGLVFVVLTGLFFSFTGQKDTTNYFDCYNFKRSQFNKNQLTLLETVRQNDPLSAEGKIKIKEQLNAARLSLKQLDFWFRYLEPLSYKKINGPLPVEWETEVFEKFEKPYRREGAGLTLASIYIDEENVSKDSLSNLIAASIKATKVFDADSITNQLKEHHHFFLSNRLYLLNLAAIYTTGFECPDTKRIIPELRYMMQAVYSYYLTFNKNFPETSIQEQYLSLYSRALEFVNAQPDNYEKFDHYVFIRDFVNPLFNINQQYIRDYHVVSRSYVDYSLNNNCNSIFSKKLYNGQNSKGVFLRVYDQKVLSEIEHLGKLLFYDPILSGNNKRSCASCHKPNDYFTDNSVVTSLQFDEKKYLPRNTPSLINSPFNHLLMLDGRHISLQDQAKAVTTNSLEMGSNETGLIKKVMSCREYKTTLKALLKYTPQEPEVSMQHISSALTMYYSKFSWFYSPFDQAMNKEQDADNDVKKGFNIYMSKAQCATCHFAPQFNGVKPPYVGSEFEVLGTPADTNFKELSFDKGRHSVNPAFETAGAFRTGTIRNAEKTAPYMHNGIFKTLNQVIDFYDGGGGAGRGLKVENQTLSSDSLHLSKDEKKYLLAFIKSLNENIVFEPVPEKLPASKIKNLNSRKVNGEY